MTNEEIQSKFGVWVDPDAIDWSKAGETYDMYPWPSVTIDLANIEAIAKIFVKDENQYVYNFHAQANGWQSGLHNIELADFTEVCNYLSTKKLIGWITLKKKFYKIDYKVVCDAFYDKLKQIKDIIDSIFKEK